MNSLIMYFGHSNNLNSRLIHIKIFIFTNFHFFEFSFVNMQEHTRKCDIEKSKVKQEDLSFNYHSQ